MRGLQAARLVHSGLVTKLWCNGVWLDALDFTAAPTDRGLMHGLGLFETILAVNGAPVFADRHLRRLRESCERLGWHPMIPDLESVMAELIELNGLANGRARIRLAISGGSGLVHDPSLGPDHVLWLTAVPAAEPPDSTTANRSPWARNERSSLSGLKCASYAENLLALQHAARLGFEETIFLNTAGKVCEGATSNLFLVRKNTVITPSLESGCLPGITRSVAIELASAIGIACEEREVDSSELDEADELFLTSSIRGIMGLSRFENRGLAPGPVTQALREAWNRAVQRKTAG